MSFRGGRRPTKESVYKKVKKVCKVTIVSKNEYNKIIDNNKNKPEPTAVPMITTAPQITTVPATTIEGETTTVIETTSAVETTTEEETTDSTSKFDYSFLME